MSTTREALKQRCDHIRGGLGQGIEWVTEVRGMSSRLERDADGLIEKLRRSRNLCRRLGSAALRPLSIGVFGMSQAGKSYLISTLARSQQGELFTALDGHRFNFIGHINPPGGGKEATGLVTRFTRRPVATPAGFPIELTLFSEADLIKILGNSFLNDFDRERIGIESDVEKIRAHLARFEAQRQPRATGGLDADDMVDLMDYFERRFTKSMEPLKSDFWPTVIELAPRLIADQRAGLLSLLWGGIDDLTRTYLQLRNALAALSYADKVYVPLEALVVPKGDAFEWNRDSIINVDVLNQLGKDGTTPLRVVPVADGRQLAETSIARPVLTALTAEMTFVLADAPVVSLLEHVDLLDFPGYRGRLKVAALDEVRKELKRDDADPVAQLLLRGKVAYLFERYTDDQEMNLLLMCTRSDQQIEITDLAPVLDAWVHATQGETAALRAEHPPGLVWVLTQFDRRLEDTPGQTETQRREAWSSMIHITLLEKFGRCGWLQEWAEGRPFDNVFLVRKPGIPKPFIDMQGPRESSIASGDADRLRDARRMFTEDERVALHIRDAGEAWDAALQLNDGGMRRLAGYLEKTAVDELKVRRLQEQLERTVTEIAEQRLGPYYFAEGAGEVAKKEAIAAKVRQAVEDRFDTVGELLHALQPPSEQLRQLYLRSDARADADADHGQPAAAEPRPRRAGLMRPGTGSGGSVAGGRAALFAKAVMSAWIKQLRDAPENGNLLRYLGLDRPVVQAVSDELITASDRLRVEERMTAALQPQEEKRSTTRERIVDQQVLLARLAVNEFVDTLGVDAQPVDQRGASPLGGRKLFEPPAPIPPGTVPRLPPDEIAYTWAYVADWLAAFTRVAIGNAGHSAGREITPEQNKRLGDILGVIRGQASSKAG